MKSLAMLLGLFLSLFVAVPAFASGKSFETEVTNNVRIGDISIDLAVYEADEDPGLYISDKGPAINRSGKAGEKTERLNSEMVLPGQTIRRIIRIKNLANPAWVRVRLEFISDAGTPVLPELSLSPQDEHWILRGDACYFTSPLGMGEEAELYEEFRIPPFWDDAHAGEHLTLVITAEAVQEANFDPDFDSPDPWFGTLIETCVHTSFEPAIRQYKTFSVSFEGGADGLVRMGDDFFENFGNLMPGDTAMDVLRLKNDYAKPVTIYFRTEGMADDILAREAKLTIRGSERLIFDGSISESRDEISIATLKKGEEENITYSLFVPPEADNDFARARTYDRWIFRAELNTEKRASSSKGGHVGSGKAAPVNTDAQEPAPAATFVYPVRELAKTGEGKAVLSAALLMVISGLFWLVIRRITHAGRSAGKRPHLR